jgi:hypothetical protein
MVRKAYKEEEQTARTVNLRYDTSQGALSGYSAATTFLPYPFSKGQDDRIFGTKMNIISNPMVTTNKVPMMSENLRHMVESTVGNAYNLANAGREKREKAAKHRDNTVKGSLLGKVATQPERYGQVPYAGRFF